MAEKKFLYEVLVRGTSDGQIAGAHQIWGREFTDDATGEVITTKHGNAEVLNAEDVKGLIAENFVGAAVQIAGLSLELSEAQNVIEAQREKISEAQAVIAAQAARIAGISKVADKLTQEPPPN